MLQMPQLSEQSHKGEVGGGGERGLSGGGSHLSSMEGNFEAMLAGPGQSWKPMSPGSQGGVP